MAFEYEESLFRTGQLPGERLPDVAIAMMLAGFDSQAVRELAGLVKPTIREAGELFEAAIATLGRAPLSEAQAVASLRDRALRRIISGEVTPIDGTADVSRVWRMLGCPEELTEIIYLQDLWDERPFERAAIEREIVETAQRLVAPHSPVA